MTKEVRHTISPTELANAPGGPLDMIMRTTLEMFRRLDPVNGKQITIVILEEDRGQ